jgi:hypothetical protein
VSALGLYLEEEGIATVAISLIRPQTENTKPPRALWVPFELGRPFGPPSDPAFQTRVVTAALRLLETPHGPVVIEDFADDDPRARPDSDWQAPQLPAAAAGASGEALAAALQREIPLLRGAHERWVARYGRTTTGLSGLTPPEIGNYVGAWLRGEAPTSPREGFSPILALRFAIDDLKAYYLEAGGHAGQPSSRQLGDWLWRATAAGAAVISLRALGLASGDERAKAVLGNFMVPAVRVAELG